MNNEIIPWPNYAICPGCSRQVPTPAREKGFRLVFRERTGEMLCPNCGALIRYARGDAVPTTLK